MVVSVFVVIIVMLALNNSLIAEDDMEELQPEQIETPTEVEELMNMFSRMKGNWMLHREGEKVHDTEMTYQYLGEEELEGEQVDKIYFEVGEAGETTSEMRFWLAQEEVKQIEVDGQIIPPEMADVMKDQILETIFSPFLMIDDFQLETMKEMGETTTAQETIAGRETEVMVIEAENIEAMELDSGRIKIADFEEYLLVVSFEYNSLEQDEQINFDLTEIEAH